MYVRIRSNFCLFVCCYPTAVNPPTIISGGLAVYQTDIRSIEQSLIARFKLILSFTSYKSFTSPNGSSKLDACSLGYQSGTNLSNLENYSDLIQEKGIEFRY